MDIGHYKNIHEYIKAHEQDLSKLNNYILKANKLLVDDSVELVVPAKIDSTGQIVLDATKIKQAKKDIFRKPVFLQSFTNDKGEIIIMREL